MDSRRGSLQGSAPPERIGPPPFTGKPGLQRRYLEVRTRDATNSSQEPEGNMLEDP